MKKAIKIFGIIWGVFGIIAVISTVIFAIACLVGVSNQELLQKIVDQIQQTYQRTITIEQAKAILNNAAIACFGATAYEVVGTVLSFVMVGKANSEMGKGAGIALGIVSFVFGSTVPGVLFIVDSAVNR